LKRLAVGLITVGLILPSIANAHGGRTNAEGCHNDRKHGGYHCHGGGRAETTSSVSGLKSSDAACGSKNLCGQMNSCDEAMHYLNDCSVTSLDGDNDGTPCESICGN
jgi:Excalibur calcium-binding domain